MKEQNNDLDIISYAFSRLYSKVVDTYQPSYSIKGLGTRFRDHSMQRNVDKVGWATPLFTKLLIQHNSSVTLSHDILQFRIESIQQRPNNVLAALN